MKFHWTSSKTRWKDSLTISLAILTTALTSTEVVGIVEIQTFESLSWWGKLIWIIALFVILTIVTFIAKLLCSLKGIKLTIADNEVHIRHADIFKQESLRLIPFNEYFDTQVDDVVIAHNSLNGIFLDSYVDNIDDLRRTIQNSKDVKGGMPHDVKGKTKYPLGQIIKYDKYLLLAFSHFNENNNAYLSHTDYEKSLLLNQGITQRAIESI